MTQAKTRGLPLNQSELERHLDEQIDFMKRSIRGYDDEGATHESKRIALAIRILLWDGRAPQTRSLLGQLGRKKGLRLIDSCFPPAQGAILRPAHSGLTILRVPVAGAEA
jgi:hypothetical protein